MKKSKSFSELLVISLTILSYYGAKVLFFFIFVKIEHFMVFSNGSRSLIKT